MQNWIIIIAILITSVSILAGVLLGSWLVFRCLRTDQMLVQPKNDGPTDINRNESEYNPEDDIEEDDDDNAEEDYDKLR
jgi:hypothetical protein